jgi:hypothetical protein
MMSDDDFLKTLEAFLKYLDIYDISIRQDYSDYYQTSWRIDKEELKNHYSDFKKVQLRALELDKE